jgi:hypothetical protein
MLLIIIIILIFAIGLYSEISENHLKEAKKEFCNIECRNYSKRY